MEIPDLVRRELGDEEVTAGVSLGDEDAVCLTPTRMLVYRGEGLLSDEGVETYSHDVEQLAVSEGRRKTKFTVQYFDGTRSFSVPANRGEKVLELFMEGVLREEEVIDDRESIVGVFRFSEMTVFIAEKRVIKHIGEVVWSDDYEVYPFADVTGLEFERASVATSFTLQVDGRPQRIKVPNDQAPLARRTLEKALFEYYDVDSLERFNRTVSAADEGSPDRGTADADPNADDELDFGTDFDPLVTEEDEIDGDLTEPVGREGDSEGTRGATGERGTSGASDPETDTGDADSTAHASTGTADEPARTESTGPESSTDSAETAGSTGKQPATTGDSATTDGATGATGASERAGEETPDAEAAAGSEPAVSREEFEAVATRVEDLTEAVERQNELLKRQHRAIKQLVRQQSENGE